jgi:hypothetical protein
MDTRDRVIDIRSALFDPVAKDLESIWTELNEVILPAINALTGGVGATTAAVGASSQTVIDGTQQVVDGLTQNAQQVGQSIDTAAAMNADGAANLAADLAQTAATTASAAATTYGAASQAVAAAVTGSGDQITSAVLDTGGQTVAALGGMSANLGAAYDSLKAGLIGQPAAPNPGDVASNTKDELSGNPNAVMNPDGSFRIPSVGDPVGYNPTRTGLDSPGVSAPAYGNPGGSPAANFSPGAPINVTQIDPKTGMPLNKPSWNPYAPSTGVGLPSAGAGPGAPINVTQIDPKTGMPLNKPSWNPYAPSTGSPATAQATGGMPVTDEFSPPTGAQLTPQADLTALNQYLAGGGTSAGFYNHIPLPTAPPPPPPGANQYGETNPYANFYAPGIPVGPTSNGSDQQAINIYLSNNTFSSEAAYQSLATQLRQNLPT